MTVTFKFKRGTGSDPSASDMVVGEPVLRTDTAELFFKKDDNSVAKVSGGGGGGPDFKYLALRNAANNGAASYPAADFTLVTSGTTTAVSPAAASALLVVYAGVIQQPNTGTSTPSSGFAISGSTIKFGSNIAAAPDFIIYQESGGIGEPSDNTVTSAKIVNGAIVNADINASAAIAFSKLATTGALGTAITATTQSASDNSTKIATTAFVSTAVTNLIGGAPGALDTLNELAAAINDDSSYASTITTSLGTKLNLSGGTLTGNVKLNDSIKTIFGSDDDAYMMHNGSHQYNRCSTGYYHIQAQELRVNKADGNQYLLRAVAGGTVELYHNGSKKFETTIAGCKSDGDLHFVGASSNMEWQKASNQLRLYDNTKLQFGDSADLQIYHSSSSGKNIYQGASHEFWNTAGNEPLAKLTENGSVELYYDDSKKLETTSTGLNITGVVVDDGATHDGDMSLNGASYNSWWDKSDNAFKFDDNAKAKFGTSGDLGIFHDGNNSQIREEGTGNLMLISNNEIRFEKASPGEAIASFNVDGACELYHDNSKKFETISSGVSVTGHVHASGAVYSDNFISTTQSNGHSMYIKARNAVGNESTLIKATIGGSVELNHNTYKKLETTSGGVLVSGNVDAGTGNFLTDDNGKYFAGTGGDLAIYHDGTNSHLKNSTGYFLIQNNGGSPLALQAVVGEESIVCDANGAVKLYYDNVKHFETTSIGCKISDNDTTSVLQFANSAGDNGYVMGESTNIIGFKDNNPDWLVRGIKDGTVELYYDGTKKFQTRTGGAYVYGKGGGTTFTAAQAMHADDRCGLEVQGALTGIKIASTYDDASHPDYGLVFVQGPSTSSYNCWSISPDGPTRSNNLNFHYQAQSGNIHVGTNCKVYMTGTGDWVPYSNNASDLGTSSKRWANLYINDLQLSNEGSQNSVDGTWGDWTLQEGEEDIFMINNRSGKKYKMALQEVS